MRRPSDLVSHALRRIAALGHFSRSPLRGSDLEVVRLPGKDAVEPGLTATLGLSVTTWTVFEHTLFAEFSIGEAGGSVPTRRALVLFDESAVAVPLDGRRSARVAIPVPATHGGTQIGLGVELPDGRVLTEPEPGAVALVYDAAALLFDAFGRALAERPPGHALEIGARARSDTRYTDVLPPGWRYTGMDVKPGPNVELVGDAHELASLVGDERFDAVFGVSVFEHLLVPWKVVLEVNRVLVDDGLLFFATHQSYPLHDRPWDFWRVSDGAWRGLLNATTGFEVVETALGEPASIVPRAMRATTAGVSTAPAYLLSAVLARKIGDPTAEWPADPSGLDQPYPA